MKIQQLGAADFKTSSWSGGTTTQIFIYPPQADYAKRDFLLRISSATVDLEKSHFTVLPNIQRFISPLTGDLKISHDEKYFTKLKPYEIYAFDGGAKTISEGKVRDFNVMVQNGSDASVKNFFLNASSALKFHVEKDEIGWLFSYNNVCPLHIETQKMQGETSASENRQVCTFNLEKITLFVFYNDTAEKRSASETETVIISADSYLSLFYGKLKTIPQKE